MVYTNKLLLLIIQLFSFPFLSFSYLSSTQIVNHQGKTISIPKAIKPKCPIHPTWRIPKWHFHSYIVLSFIRFQIHFFLVLFQINDCNLKGFTTYLGSKKRESSFTWDCTCLLLSFILHLISGSLKVVILNSHSVKFKKKRYKTVF